MNGQIWLGIFFYVLLGVVLGVGLARAAGKGRNK